MSPSSAPIGQGPLPRQNQSSESSSLCALSKKTLKVAFSIFVGLLNFLIFPFEIAFLVGYLSAVTVHEIVLVERIPELGGISAIFRVYVSRPVTSTFSFFRRGVQRIPAFGGGFSSFGSRTPSFAAHHSVGTGAPTPAFNPSPQSRRPPASPPSGATYGAPRAGYPFNHGAPSASAPTPSGGPRHLAGTGASTQRGAPRAGHRFNRGAPSGGLRHSVGRDD